jgi:hypothetical protein
MKKQFRLLKCLSTLLLSVSTTSSFAGGSLGSDELLPLLAQKPEIRDAILSSLVLSDSAFGEVRLGSHFTHLGGERLGPYTIRAKVKQSGKPIQLVLCTTSRFLSQSGRPLSEDDMFDAVRVEEKLDFVMLRDAGAQSRPGC